MSSVPGKYRFCRIGDDESVVLELSPDGADFPQMALIQGIGQAENSRQFGRNDLLTRRQGMVDR